jgi:hypothetical protein
VQALLTGLITDHASAVSNGNGYSDDVQVEAAERGLPNLRTTFDALPELVTDASVQLFERCGIFTESEVHSRYEIGLDHFTQSMVEALSTINIGQTSVPPAGVRYQTELATNVTALRSAGTAADMDPARGGHLGHQRPADGHRRVAHRHRGVPLGRGALHPETTVIEVSPVRAGARPVLAPATVVVTADTPRRPHAPDRPRSRRPVQG